MKIDSKKKSLFEAGCNIIIGYTVNFGANAVILPFFGIPFSWAVFGLIGVFYTFVSLARSYLIRRLFVKGFYETVFGSLDEHSDKVVIL